MMKKELCMKRIIPWIFVLMFTAQSVLALTAREIMEKSDGLPEPDTMTSNIVMTIKTGSTTVEKEFILDTKKYAKYETKSLIAFSRPAKIKLLTYTHPKGEDDQWLMMSSGKVKRITATSKDSSFVNSHFCYEDLSSRRIDDYTYELMGDTNVLGADCFKIEATRKTEPKVYDKVILSVRKSDFFVVKIEFFVKGKHIKTLENKDIRSEKGIMNAYDLVMTEQGTNDSTELKIKSLTMNGAIPDSKFNKDALR
jgi:outer membrane lipoprotein-sorting protein